MEETISLKELFGVLKKRFWIIAIITFLATVASGIYSFYFMTPIYQSSTQILVNQTKTEQAGIDFYEIQSNLGLIETYSDIIKSPTILEKVASRLNLDQPGKSLSGQININSGENSQVFTITIEDENPATAAKIANTVATTFQQEIPQLMKVDNVNILSEAEENPSPIKPRPLINTLIAFVVGLMSGVGLVFLLEYLDDTIKTEKDAEELLNLPVLGVVFELNKKNMKKHKGDTHNLKVRGEAFDA